MNSEECEYEKELKKMTKAELIQECLNQRERGDIEYDKYCNAQDELNSVETYEDEFYLLEEIRDLIGRMRISKERYDSGILTELEEYNELIEELFTYEEN